MSSKEKVLVLGANGFIGSHIVDRLVEGGYLVRAFDGFTSNMTRFNTSDDVEIFQGNFLNQSDIQRSLKGIDYVIHLVSTTTPAAAEADPLIDIETNIRGSVELFQACVAAGVKRVIYSSSGGTVYGEREGVEPEREDDRTEPVSPYGIAKLTVEHYLRYFRVKHGLSSTVFRIANPYGERQPLFRKQGVIPIFIEKALKDEQITILGDGSMVRDYIYVKDVADMMVRTLSITPKHEVYNIGSGVGYSVNQVVEEIELAAGIKMKKKHAEAPSTFVHTSLLDICRYEDEFGAYIKTGLSVGIKRTYDYVESQLSDYAKVQKG